MRYAFVSDIHANLQAWKTVYQDILANNVDRIISLGDVVGYGPDPRGILKEIRTKVDAYVLGNHDAVVCGKIDDSLFNDDARRLLDWTKKQLTAEDLTFLGTFPLTLVGDGYRCAHGEFTEPANFDYVRTAEEALPSWKAVEDNLLIVGHTHQPALYVLGSSGVPRSVEPQDFVMEPGKRYFVNIGSVGQPRGTDIRSCYCIYDSETKAVFWRRVSFDLDAYRKSVKATGLTLDSSYYLQPPPKGKPAAPADQPAVFTPPKSSDKAAHDVVATQDIKVLPRRPQKMPLNLKIILLVIALIISGYIWRALPHAAEIAGTTDKPVACAPGNMLALPLKAIEPGNPIPKWNIHLKDKYRQDAGVNLNSFGKPFLYLRSKRESQPLQASSCWITALPGQVWVLDVAAQKYKTLKGGITVSLVFTPRGGVTRKVLFTQEVGTALASGLSKIQGRVTIPAPGGMIQTLIQGNFSGTILFPQFSLLTDGGVPAPSEPEIQTPPPPAPAEAPTETPALPEPGTALQEAPPPPAVESNSAPAEIPGKAADDPWAMPPKK